MCPDDLTVRRNQKISLVEDKQENLFALRRVLSDLGAVIVEASSGNKALVATLDHHYALASPKPQTSISSHEDV